MNNIKISTIAGIKRCASARHLSKNLSWHNHMNVAFLSLLITLFASCSPSTNNEERNAGSDLLEKTSQLTTLYIVRHAEQRTNDGDDPGLNPKGKQRAVALAAMLKEAGIDAVYSTPYQRAMATGKPLADSLTLSVQAYDPDQDLREVVDAILDQHQGEQVLIVGHSTTVPGMLNVLVEENRYPDLVSGQHDDLFQVLVATDDLRQVNHLKNLCQP